jgi:cytidylate kinase
MTGIETTYEAVLENLTQRDRIDSSREDSPLTMTIDYKVLDNSDMSRDDQFELALGWVNEVLG